MPIPKPNSGEEKKDFIQRCVTDNKMKSEYPDIDQRLAVCSTSYEENLSNVKDSKGKRG